MIISKPATEEYREGWERVFGEVRDRAQPSKGDERGTGERDVLLSVNEPTKPV